jgi:hypothetical protein
MKPSSSPQHWRVVNLALGVSACYYGIAVWGLLPLLSRSGRLFESWFGAVALDAIPGVVVHLAQMGLNFGLLAAGLLLLFWRLGMHRSCERAPRNWPHTVLLVFWLFIVGFHIVAIPLIEHLAGNTQGARGALGLIFGMVMLPVTLVGTWAATWAASREYGDLRKGRNEHAPHFPKSFALVAAIPVIAVLPLLVWPTNPIATKSRDDAQFEAICKNAGVQWLGRVSGPVRSVAYDWDPALMKGMPQDQEIHVDDQGAITSTGSTGLAYLRAPGSNRKIPFDFVEQRRDPTRVGAPTVNPRATFVRSPSSGPYFGIDAFTADLLVHFEVTPVDDANRSAGQRKAEVNRVTITDRRTGQQIGTHQFVVDRLGKRACGLNASKSISLAALIDEAISR